MKPSGPHGGGGSALRVTKDDHLEEMFGRAAIRAHPVFGDILPTGARRNAVLRQPQGFIIGKPATEAHKTEKRVFGHDGFPIGAWVLT